MDGKCEHLRWKNNCRICFPRLVCHHGKLRVRCRVCRPEIVDKMMVRDRRVRHSFTPADELRFRDAQAGKIPCDFCGLPFENGETPYVDHDHACCPETHHCRECMRGLVHAVCNTHAIAWMEAYERKTGIVVDLLRRYKERFRRD